jgi:putative toxin-antitoxin system antitoxin component (TIGR02293 family)
MEYNPFANADEANPSTGLRFQEAARVLDLEEENLAHRCGMSRSTFYRRKVHNGPFTMGEEDMLDRHVVVFNQAMSVFEDRIEARTWLLTPQYGLGGMIPLDAIQTTAGFREVEKLLTRIDYGVYA